MAVPCRYIDSPAAITSTKGVENTIRLVQAFLERISP